MVVGAVGTVIVLVGAGAVTVRVGVCTVTLVVCEVVTVETTGFVTVVELSLPLFDTASAIPTPAARATITASTIGQGDRFGRILCPHVGQNSAPGGTGLPHSGHWRGGSGGSCRVGSSVMRPKADTQAA